MGGASRGAASACAVGVRLAGEVSLENGGGFASFRRDVEWPDLSAWDGLRLRVRGDGKTYKLGLRTARAAVIAAGRAVDWQASFETRAGAWTEVELAFASLVPTWRGRVVADAPRFDASSVRELGVLIAGGQAGEFALELGGVEAWSMRSTREGRPGGS
jgi:monofunctional biosynthetic peptidoglycan transglycosylase